MNGTLWIPTMATAMLICNTTTMLFQMDGQVPMILMPVNTLVTCMMEKLYGFCGDLDSCYVQNSSSDPTTESDYTYTNDADCQLDECNMYNMDGEMVYVMTPSWPYVPNCMKGDVQTAYGFTP